MAYRNSTLAQQYQGQDVKTQFDGEQYNTTFGGDPTNIANSPELTKLIGEATVPASVDPVTYGVIKSYFIARGASNRNASAMVLLLIDSAKLQGTTPLKLLEDFKQTNIALSDIVHYTINKLSNPSYQIGTATTKDNSQSYKSTYIRA
jgi:hypothetical protein